MCWDNAASARLTAPGDFRGYELGNIVDGVFRYVDPAGFYSVSREQGEDLYFNRWPQSFAAQYLRRSWRTHDTLFTGMVNTRGGIVF